MKLLIILVALLGCIYNLLLKAVELGSSKNPTPANVADVYDAETYEKWRRYNAEHSRLGIIFGVINCAVTLALLIFNLYAAFAGIFLKGTFWQLFAVVLLETLVSFIIGIPQSYISTMIIEEKYGFNRSTMKTFIIDQIRSLLIGLALSLFLAGLVAVAHIWLGSYMAILCIAVLVLFVIGMSFLSPILTRIGNKFVPLEEGELRTSLEKLLTSHGYQVRAIEVMDASRRTTKLNAYFTGMGKMKTIVLYDNLVAAMTSEEICAVFSHELGHGLHKDVTKLQVVNTLNFVLIALAAWLFASVDGFYSAFGFEGLNYGFTYILLGIGMSVIQPFTSLITNGMSRRFEFAADRQAVTEGYGEAMIPALKKLAKDNFANLAPSPLYVFLEYSHPPIDKRIEAIEKELAKG